MERTDKRLPSDEELGMDLLRGEVAAVVRRSVSRILKGMFSTTADRDDLAQEIRTEILRRRRWFDPQRGSWPAFATVVARGQESRLRRDFLRRQRPIGGAEQVPAPIEDAEAVDLRLDLAAAQSTLPAELARLAHLVQADFVATVARRLGIPRRTLRSKLAKLRAHLARHKLLDYWPKNNAS